MRRRASNDPAAASISPNVPSPAGPSAGTVEGGGAKRNVFPNRICAIANPPAPGGAVTTALVIGVGSENAINSAPL